MKNTELRIGNYLQGKNSHVIVKAILTDGHIKIEGNSSFFKIEGANPCLLPIPLTEEWLLKFGFNTNNNRVFFRGEVGYEFGFTNRAIYKVDEIGFVLYKHIQHVHQLQNLYFSLTNTEL